MDLASQSHALLVVYTLYIVATASPGPSNMAIMGIAMRQGRLPALAFTAGVMTGSITWALLAATGISTLLAAYANAIFAIKIGGGLYLLFLGWKAARSAIKPQPLDRSPVTGPVDYGRLYRRGLMLHLTNPKSILSWIAIMSLGLQAEAPGRTILAIIAGCALLGITVFGGYALLFSTDLMVRLYQKTRRWIEATLALFFGFAGIRLLMTRL
ncbi:amino acid transporter [Labrys miyagiensis]|uniref:Amino acid transporter n=1 Tax=Labrys miyagiensis TaxID=346912 RepID=A0ABQ6CEK3_9HYPH|nr:LysE family translocator [Labrys miyagiensis]GLS18654.1 amino acid transporter [Labrys miyagiensis]